MEMGQLALQRVSKHAMERNSSSEDALPSLSSNSWLLEQS